MPDRFSFIENLVTTYCDLSIKHYLQLVFTILALECNLDILSL